jgi:hypothetical protein
MTERRNSEVGQMLAPMNEFVLTIQSNFINYWDGRNFQNLEEHTSFSTFIFNC